MTTATSPATTGKGSARVVRARAAAPEFDPLDVAIDKACRTLHLPEIRAQWGELAETAARERRSYRAFLAEVLSVECQAREERGRVRRVREANFPRPKRLEDFAYEANPYITPELLGTLADPAWVNAGLPLCLIGNSGTGKSHLLIGIGTAIAEAGLKAKCTTTAALVNELVEAASEQQLSRTIARCGRVDLLCLDEFGYLGLDKAGAKLLFQVFTEREERCAIAIASNAPFGERNQTITDPRLCAAIVDRVTFNAHTVETGTDSYRLAAAKAHRAAT